MNQKPRTLEWVGYRAIAAGMLTGTLMLLSGPVEAASKTWNPATSDWNATNNWIGGTPTASDVAVFNSAFSLQPALSTNGDAVIWAATGLGQDVIISGAYALNGTPLDNGVIVNGFASTAVLLDDAANHNLTIATTSFGARNSSIRNNSAGILTITNLATLNTVTLAGTVAGGVTVINASSGGGSIVINTAGTVKMSGVHAFNGTMTLTAGTWDIGTGCTVNGNVSGNGVLITTTAASGISFLTNSANKGLNIGGTIQDGANAAVAIYKSSNVLTLYGSNSYSGGTTLSSTTLLLGSDIALGTGALVINTGCSIKSASSSARALANSVSIVNGATFGDASTGNLTFGTLASSAGTLTINNAQTTFSSISAGTLNKAGTGALIVSGNATAGGGASLNAGILAVGGVPAFNNTLTMGGGVLGMNGIFSKLLGGAVFNVTFSSTADGSGFAAYGGDLIVAIGGTNSPTALTWAGDGAANRFVGNGKVLVLGNALATGTVDFRNALNLNGAPQTVQVDDGSAAIDASLSGVLTNGGLTKTGAGVLALTATNTYSGATIVSNGALLVNGSLTATASASVIAGATLGGTGMITASGGVDVGGKLSAGGDAIGTLTLAGNLGLGSSSTFKVQVDGAVVDKVAVNGTVTLSAGAQLSVTEINPVAVGSTLLILENDGGDAISGEFAGLPEGASLTIGGASWVISYVGGSGNDICLRAAPKGTLLLLF